MNEEKARELGELVHLVVSLKEQACLTKMRALLDQGVRPMAILEACIEGLQEVGDRFARGEYFIAALIMAGEIMREATELLHPLLGAEQPAKRAGRVLLGTIKGDIHNLGKDLFALLLQSKGFDVVDLGVDVAPGVFLEKAQAVHPDIIGISCVLTFGIDACAEAVTLLRDSLGNDCPPILVGGACVDAHIGEVVGADHWANDAGQGLRICEGLGRRGNPLT